jgi:hypothetical protein
MVACILIGNNDLLRNDEGGLAAGALRMSRILGVAADRWAIKIKNGDGFDV